MKSLRIQSEKDIILLDPTRESIDYGNEQVKILKNDSRKENDIFRGAVYEFMSCKYYNLPLINNEDYDTKFTFDNNIYTMDFKSNAAALNTVINPQLHYSVNLFCINQNTVLYNAGRIDNDKKFNPKKIAITGVESREEFLDRKVHNSAGRNDQGSWDENWAVLFKDMYKADPKDFSKPLLYPKIKRCMNELFFDAMNCKNHFTKTSFILTNMNYKILFKETSQNYSPISFKRMSETAKYTSEFNSTRDSISRLIERKCEHDKYAGYDEVILFSPGIPPIELGEKIIKSGIKKIVIWDLWDNLQNSVDEWKNVNSSSEIYLKENDISIIRFDGVVTSPVLFRNETYHQKKYKNKQYENSEFRLENIEREELTKIEIDENGKYKKC